MSSTRIVIILVDILNKSLNISFIVLHAKIDWIYQVEVL